MFEASFVCVRCKLTVPVDDMSAIKNVCNKDAASQNQCLRPASSVWNTPLHPLGLSMFCSRTIAQDLLNFKIVRHSSKRHPSLWPSPLPGCSHAYPLGSRRLSVERIDYLFACDMVTNHWPIGGSSRKNWNCGGKQRMRLRKPSGIENSIQLLLPSGCLQRLKAFCSI